MNIFFKCCFRLTIILLIFSLQSIYAQINISGRIINSDNNPIEYVSTELFIKDSLIYQTVTNENGEYLFSDVKPDQYLLKVRHFAFEKDSVQYINVEKNTVLNFQFSTDQLLEEITIESKKPVLQREIDRLRFNVEDTDLVIGNNVWEVIEKTPLVNVSSDGNIQISGVTNAVVYINDKRKILSGNALKSYLSSLPSNNLRAIEVITTPPSKYEAEGGAGIINIITKKSEEEGIIGNIVLSTRQTRLNSNAASSYLNFRQGKWNLYTSLYVGERKRKTDFQKNIYYNDSDLLEREIHSYNNTKMFYPGANIGVDYEINKNHIVGIIFDYSSDKHTDNRNAFSNDKYTSADSLNVSKNIDDLWSKNYSFNFNYEGKLDSLGQKIKFNYDVTIYDSSNKSMTLTESKDILDNSFLRTESWFRSSSPQNVKSHSFKLDYELPLSNNTSFDAGVILTYSQIENDIIFENTENGIDWDFDTSRSNRFKYNENILAFYSSFRSRLTDQFSYQLGLRLENTIAKGWLEESLSVDRNYLNLFPTIYLKYTTKKEKDFVLALSSRISRPSYWDVNPFRSYITDEMYFEGNPFLNPSKYYRQELNHTIKSKMGTFILQLATSQTVDEFYALPFNPSENFIVNRKVNYGNKYGISQTVSYYGQFYDWWTVSGSILGGYVLSKGQYEDVNIDNKSILASISVNQSFIISEKHNLTGSIFANNTFPVTIVNTKIKNRLATEIRLRKKWNNFNFTLSAQDLLKSNKDRYYISVNDLRVIDINYHDTRSVAFTISYDFGKSTVKSRRKRTVEFEEMKQRIK